MTTRAPAVLKKHTLNPEITLLCQCHAQKALFKGLKSEIKIFGLKMTPLPSKLFRKFVRFGGGRLPLPGSGKNVPSLLLIKNSLREFSTMFATADTNRNGRIDFDE